jgi:hypothetical protein
MNNIDSGFFFSFRPFLVVVAGSFVSRSAMASSIAFGKSWYAHPHH